MSAGVTSHDADRDPGLEGTPPASEAADVRWHLEDQRDFLMRSLDDAEREHDAGDLSDDDHRVLVTRDQARLAEVEAELEVLGFAAVPDATDEGTSAGADTGAEAETPRRRFSPWRAAGIGASLLLIATGVVILVAHALSPRLPGQPSSGSISLPVEQQIERQLTQAQSLNNRNDPEGAIELYNKVLSEDPSDPEALADAGWLQWNIGSASKVTSLTRIGRAEVTKAVQVAPSYYQGHLYLGLIEENQDHNDAGAVAQFDQFLADSPPSAELPQVAPLVVGAYKGAGVAVPAALSAASTTTTP